MTFQKWRKKMEEVGWKLHYLGWQKHPTLEKSILAIEWRHESVTKADGTPITIDLDCANEHWQAGTTPPPF